MENIPPCNPDIERSLLSALIGTKWAFKELLGEGVTATTFYKPAHSLIFSTLYEMQEEGVPINRLSLCDLLAKAGRIEQIGGEAAIEALASKTGVADVKYFSRILRNLEMKRIERSVAISIRGMTESEQSDGFDILSALESNIARIKEDFQPSPKGLTEYIKEFIESTTGTFQSTEVIKYLQSVNSSQQKANNRTISSLLCRLMKDGIIQREGTKNGVWRKVNDDCPAMDWIHADITPLPVRWPFEIEKYAAVLPKSIVIVSGESNAGKTAFLLNTALKNMNDFEVSYFNSEMCEEELLLRVRKFDTLLPEHWNVKFFTRHDNFADVIRPDGFNIIDYLEVYEDFYKIGGYLKEISKKLNKGIAVVALQKDPKKDFGQGGAITKNLSRLYLSLKHDKANKTGVCEIEKGKIWADCINPDHMTVRYRLHQGAHFHAKDWEMP